MCEINRAKKTERIPINFLCQALEVSRATLYRKTLSPVKQTSKKLSTNPIKTLSDEQRQTILNLLHSEKFVDKTPYEIYYSLLDEGKYHCSIRTMYRLLEIKGENRDRRRQRCHRDAVKPELIATAPNQVWSWDITKLLSEQRLLYYHLYVIIDIFSRYVVGWLIAEGESKDLARKLIQETTLKQGIKPDTLCLHADNGPSMKSGTVGDLLEHLSITKSHNRPYTSNDNPFSESQFKTLKYCPQFPKRFSSLKDAEKFCRQFFRWYNQERYHSGINWLTPELVHYSKGEQILKKRHEVLLKAYHADPVRFNCKKPTLRQSHKAVYINPPENNLISALQVNENMA